MQITTMVCSQEFRNCNNLIHISDALSVSIISEQFLTDNDSITASGSDHRGLFLLVIPFCSVVVLVIFPDSTYGGCLIYRILVT